MKTLGIICCIVCFASSCGTMVPLNGGTTFIQGYNQPMRRYNYTPYRSYPSYRYPSYNYPPNYMYNYGRPMYSHHFHGGGFGYHRGHR